MRADQILVWLHRRKTQTSFEGEGHPVSKGGSQFGECFFFCSSGCQEPAETRDACHEALLITERGNLSAFQGLASVGFQHLHAETTGREGV